MLGLSRTALSQTPVSGQAVPSLAQLDTIMQQYMTQYHSPGANLSVSVDGRLVFARGYGYANTTTGEFVQPDSRMRLASNSKVITAVGILKLIEQGKLTLATTPFTSILAGLTPPSGTTKDPRVNNITIQNLLEHKAGYDDGAGYPPDPVFYYATVTAAATAAGQSGQETTPAELISYELGVPLQHDPGTTYAYSNLGYLTLGYIIEKVTGVPYATWIEQNIFTTANMTQTLPAGNLASQKLPYEVAYYGYSGEPLGPSMIPPVGSQVPYEYGGYDLVLALANGGWTSTPMDLLRFWDTLNGQYSYNILSGAQSTRVAADVPPLGQGYYYNFYGSLPGTNSLVHLNTSTQVVGRVVYSAIFNTRDGSNIEEPETDADNAIQTFVQTVKAWPTGDLFPTYASAGTACAFTLPTATANVPVSGSSSGTVALTDANYCAWSGTTSTTWIHLTTAGPFSDSGSVAYTVDANTGTPRTGTILLGGQSFTVSQAGVTTPTTLTLTGTGNTVGGTETVNLKAVLSPYTQSGNSTDGEIVTFQNGGNNAPLGTAKLTGGVATLTVVVPNPAINSFGASYPGDTNFSSSFAANLAITPTTTSASVSPASLTFASTPTNLVSASQTSTFTNTGTTALTINTIVLSGQFKQTNNCPSSVAAGGTCTFTVTFNPTTTGPATGTIDVNDQAGDQIISLSGTAVAAAPVVTLSASSLTFASTTINTSSAPQAVTVTNTGNAPLSISNIAAISGNNQFTQTNNCTTAAIAINASCTVNVTFSPTTTGPLTASVVITDNASPTTQTVALSGTGAAGPTPAVTLAPASLTFPTTQVASTSAAQSSVLTNSGTAALSVSGITVSSGFAQTNNCPASLAVGASCTINVTSTPAGLGAYSGTVTLADNASNSPQTIALSGTGAAYSAPTIALTGTASLTYGQAESLMATATGTQTSATYTWSVMDGATTIASGIAYTATLSYSIATPTAGSHSYTAVLVSSNASVYPGGTSNAVAVTVAKASTTSAYATPAAITYGAALGSAQLNATSTTPGAFTYSPAAGTVLPAGTSALSATLTPTDATDYSTSSANTTILVNKATLTVVAANATRPYGAANPTFSGTVTGLVNSDPITATYASTAAANAAAGSSAPITVTLADPNSRLANYNVTTTPATLTIVQAGSTLTLSAPATVALGASATVTATVASATTGTPTGTVTFTSGTTTLGSMIPLVNGVASVVVALPSGSATVTATYSGDTNFTVSSNSTSIVTGAPDFAVTSSSGTATIAAGRTATFVLTATPVNGFSASVVFACSGLPARAACVFSPAAVTPSGAPASTTLQINTFLVSKLEVPGIVPRGIAGTVLALLFFPLLRRRGTKRLRSLLTLLLLLGMGGVALTLSGCASSDFGLAKYETTPGNYTVTVTATAGATTHSTPLVVTIQ